MQPEITTCPRRASDSSILVLFRLLVQPANGQGSTLVSGTSRESSGRFFSNSARMSQRNGSLVSATLRWGMRLRIKYLSDHGR